MSDQDGKQATALPHPAPEDSEAWKAYWQAQGQPWRTMPEIDAKRQEELAQWRQVAPDIEKGIYPFKGMKLNRADVEWLLATHKNGRGPVNWSDEDQRGREGLDLRGANLSHENLSGLPLARLCGGVHLFEGILQGFELGEEQRDAASICLEGADLHDAHLEGASLYFANARGAKFLRTSSENANLAGHN